MINWIKIEEDERSFPEEGRSLLYFHEGTGVWVGFYYGRDEEYPCSNNHVFGGNVGFLTGDVTHWAYIPDYPEGQENHAKMNAEYARVLKGDVDELKKPIGSSKHGSLNNYTAK